MSNRDSDFTLPDYGEMDLSPPSPEQTPKHTKMESVRRLLKSPGSIGKIILRSRSKDNKKQNRLSRMRPSDLLKDPKKYDDLSPEDKAKLERLIQLELDL
jgi:hypothetical protein